LCHLTLVEIQTDHVTCTEEAHHHTQRVEPQGADGEVARPPSAQANEKNEIKSGESGWKCYAYRDKSQKHGKETLQSYFLSLNNNNTFEYACITNALQCLRDSTIILPAKAKRPMVRIRPTSWRTSCAVDLRRLASCLALVAVETFSVLEQ